jgi:indole-3-glycerol phosphate synthase
MSPFPKKYSLKDFLLQDEFTIIAECKKASPSAGIIRKDYNPLEHSKIYNKNGAKAISVLTDRDFFQGSIQDLELVSQKIPLPILRKDFILNEKQIYEASRFGASAILLIVRILKPNVLRFLLEKAYQIGLEVLVETHTINEAKIALDNGAEIIGINTRDLDDFRIHPNLIKEIATYLPKHTVKVGESGIKNKSDLFEMRKYVNSALIGTYFMEKEDIDLAFKNLIS